VQNFYTFFLRYPVEGIAMLIHVDPEAIIHPITAHRPVVHQELCLQCGTCASFCTTNCIEMGSHGYFAGHPERCIGCGVCAQVCPQHAIEIVAVGGIAVMA
jgi:Pyruvate/2-oxoacid:ferredoxin oxidoreductase delta subunit